MEKNDSHKFDLIASILHGEETDQQQLLNGMSESDQDFTDAQRIYALKDQVVQLGKLNPEEKAWQKVKARISPHGGSAWQKWLSYAAVFVAAVLITTAIQPGNRWFREKETFAAVIAPRGQITSLTLFDGSVVWLNSGSTIRYSNQYGKKLREVTIEGEALFEVHKDQQKSFIVNMGKSQVKVHGTVFNARYYPNEKEVALLEGAIEYCSQGQSVMVKPNERVREQPGTGKITVERVDASIYSSWVGGKVFFDTETLENLSQRLERWYDIAFVFEKEKIKSYHFTGVINKDKSLDYTLNIIQLTNKVKFRKERDKIIITE